jgi:carboxymethylenebutenolidase
MGEWIELTAKDGHRFAAYTVMPDHVPRGGLVVLQEIFGVTGHIQAVADSYAKEGYAVIAPALFDRARRDVALAYSNIPEGKALVESLDPTKTLEDVDAAVGWAKQHGKVALIGFCWGGTLAHVGAAKLEVDAAVAYYGGMVAKFLDHLPKVPMLYHFGANDMFIPATDIDAIRQAMGSQFVHVYEDVGHGFNCDERADFNAKAAALARARTLAFIEDAFA